MPFYRKKMLSFGLKTESQGKSPPYCKITFYILIIDEKVLVLCEK